MRVKVIYMKQPDRYETLVRQYSEPLYWHIRRLVVCHEDAQDILQDTFSSMFLHLWQLKDPEKAKSWLYTVATNRAFRFLKRKAREIRCDDISEYLENQLAESEYVNYEKAANVDLHRAILRLPKMQQVVFHLRFFDEMEYEEISRVTGSSIDSLRVSYSLAKRKVTQFINEEQL